MQGRWDMANEDMDRVVPLGQLDDFAVAEGEPDARGWNVLASDGRKIGEIDELLVDPRAMKVRYLDVDVDDDMIGEPGDRHVLIPIGYARLDRDRDAVLVDALASDDLRTLPAYDQGPLTREHETTVRDRFAAGAARAGEEDDFYTGDAFDEDRFYGRDRADRERRRLDDDWNTRRVGGAADL
jgi:photosynthetic reaction center H subunit